VLAHLHRCPICIPCTRKQRPRAICVGCRRDNQVSYRTAVGEPLCSSCGATHSPCAQCGRTLRIQAITPDGDELCQTCRRHHPAHKRPCNKCGRPLIGTTTACARPRMARNTALVELASELPAVVVSRLLGVHQNTADAWKRIGVQDNAYAAEVASRP
jgi:hypothetical protein